MLPGTPTKKPRFVQRAICFSLCNRLRADTMAFLVQIDWKKYYCVARQNQENCYSLEQPLEALQTLVIYNGSRPDPRPSILNRN